MDLHNLIKPCFGCDDHILASHPLNEERLRILIKDCRSTGVSYEDIEKEVIDYLTEKNLHHSIRLDHMDEQIKRLKTYWK